MTATIRHVARPRGALTKDTIERLADYKALLNEVEKGYRQLVVGALAEGSFSEVAKATGLSTNTLQRWKRESGK